jgi:hypothetical protein
MAYEQAPPELKRALSAMRSRRCLWLEHSKSRHQHEAPTPIAQKAQPAAAGDTFSPAETIGLGAYTNPVFCGETEGGQMSRRSKRMRKRTKQRLASHARRLKR